MTAVFLSIQSSKLLLSIESKHKIQKEGGNYSLSL